MASWVCRHAADAGLVSPISGAAAKTCMMSEGSCPAAIENERGRAELHLHQIAIAPVSRRRAAPPEQLHLRARSLIFHARILRSRRSEELSYSEVTLKHPPLVPGNLHTARRSRQKRLWGVPLPPCRSQVVSSSPPDPPQGPGIGGAQAHLRQFSWPAAR